jgi:hypothetical protein
MERFYALFYSNTLKQDRFLNVLHLQHFEELAKKIEMSYVRDTHALQQMFSAVVEHGHTPGGSMGWQLRVL